MTYKILNINNYHYPRGGSDNYFLQLTQLLKDQGHSVATFSSSKGKVINPEWMLVDPVKGVDTGSAVSLANVSHFIYSSEAKRQLCLAIEKFKPDLAHLHIYYGQLSSSVLSALEQYDIPMVQTVHEFKLVCPTQGLFADGNYCDDCKGKNYWRAALKRCNRGSFARSVLSMTEAYVADYLGAKSNIDQFIAVSEFQKNKLIELGVDQQKLTVLPHFADCAPLADIRQGKYFLYAGRIHDDKGIETLLKAYSIFCDKLQQKSLPLKIAGEGENREYWQAYAVELGISDCVEWLGHQDKQALDTLYAGCLALVNPSLLNETFGLTCLEALAMGKPVIASNVGALSEIISDGEDGVLVEAGNPSALANAMQQFINGQLDATAMGEKGYNKVKEQFNKHKHYAGLMAIYNNVKVK